MMPAADTFESLVHAINRPRRDLVTLGPRFADTLSAVITVLRERGELVQFDGTLAIRLPDSKHPTTISLSWLQSHLARTFQFVDQGKPAELPPALAKFVLRQWAAFPEVIKLAVYDDPKRKHRPLRSTGGRRHG